MANVPTTIGRYEIVKAIGHGGMGALYLAWDAKLERQIAIKVLKEDDPDLRERFAREAKSAARLRHPHIVTIFELGEHAEQPYIAMEYIHGRTLAQIIREREDMPLGRTLELMAELCDGLAFAHRAGIIHRDVKPANIMVDEQGSLKILDFGIARLAESAGMTQAGAMIGTLNYMSPEQVTGLPADHRSDIFAVGLVFYELLAQKEAFPGSISTGILHKILHNEPVPLAEVCPDLDEDVIRIVGRAIEKDANRRYQDLTEMRRQILTVRAHVEAGAEVTRVRDTPSPLVPPKSSSARRASERGQIAQRRASQIQHLLDEADRAVKEERYDSAIVACEHLLMLDAENVRALDLLDCARAAVEARPVNQQPSQVEGARVALKAKEAEVSEPTIVRPSVRSEPVDLHLRHVPLPAREAPPSARPVVQPAPPQSGSRGWKIAIAAVVVILLAGGVYYRFGPSTSPAPTPTPQAAAPVTQLPPPAPSTAPAPPPIDPQVTRANELVSEGQRLLAESKLDQARAKFQEAQALVATPAAQEGLAEVDRRQAQLAAAERDQAQATAAAAEARRVESARKASIALFTEGQKLEQQGRYDAADEKYREALATDKNNKQAAAAFGRSERYAKAKATGLAAVKANDRERALIALGDARSIHSARFLADGLDKAIGDNTRGRAAPPPAPTPSTPAPTPSAPAPALTADQSAIAAVLGALAKALSTETNKSRDVSLVRQVWPRASGDVFGDNESQEYVFGKPVFVELTADSASVDCSRGRSMRSRSGATNGGFDNVRIELRKSNGRWQVMSIVERSK